MRVDSTRYECLQSVADDRAYVICRQGEFEQLPEYLRHQGPWHVVGRGDIYNLKISYRLRLARYGFVLEHTDVAQFSVEISGPTED
jgi:hypothetical protein